MDVITYTDARKNLASTMQTVCDDHQPVVITRQNAEPVVMISLKDYESLQETEYLLSNPANAEKLRSSVKDIESRKTTRLTLDDLDAL